MKENENLLEWSTSIMTIPLSSVIFFFSEKFTCRLSWAKTIRLSEKDVFMTAI